MQAEAEATSSDGAVTVAIGDHYPVFVDPRAVLSFAAIGEGGLLHLAVTFTIDPGAGAGPPDRPADPDQAVLDELDRRRSKLGARTWPKATSTGGAKDGHLSKALTLAGRIRASAHGSELFAGIPSRGQRLTWRGPGEDFMSSIFSRMTSAKTPPARLQSIPRRVGHLAMAKSPYSVRML